jgi:hypothetical protein
MKLDTVENRLKHHRNDAFAANRLCNQDKKNISQDRQTNVVPKQDLCGHYKPISRASDGKHNQASTKVRRSPLAFQSLLEHRSWYSCSNFRGRRFILPKQYVYTYYEEQVTAQIILGPQNMRKVLDCIRSKEHGRCIPRRHSSATEDVTHVYHSLER